MAENTTQKDEKKEKKKFLIIIIIGIIIIILLILALIFVIMRENQEKENIDPINQHLQDGKLQYDKAAIILDQDALQQAFNEMYEKVEDGYISLSHKNQAVSSDGKSFQCYIQNNIDNKYDLFVNIYKDETAQEQLYLSGLIPPGSGIDHFESEVKLEPGTYDALLVVTQVEDDHETIRDGQLFLTLHLTVTQ